MFHPSVQFYVMLNVPYVPFESKKGWTISKREETINKEKYDVALIEVEKRIT
jgi:hypothetical protein